MVGRIAYIVVKTGKRVSLSGLTDKLRKPLLVEIVDVALMYDCEKTWNSYLLILNNASYVRSLIHFIFSMPHSKRGGSSKLEIFLVVTPSMKNSKPYDPILDFRGEIKVGEKKKIIIPEIVSIRL